MTFPFRDLGIVAILSIAILFIMLLLGVMASESSAQDDFVPPDPLPTNPAPIIVPDFGLTVPSISPERKAAAARAADRYDARAAGMDNFTGYWCNIEPRAAAVALCGVFAYLAPIYRIQSAGLRLIERDPLDPRFRDPYDPVIVDIGLGRLPDDFAFGGGAYLNWLAGNTESLWAWADMVRITADRASTCRWLIELPNNDCNWGVYYWQIARLNWGLGEMAYLQDEAGNIQAWLRDWFWNMGLNNEGSALDEGARGSYETAIGLDN